MSIFWTINLVLIYNNGDSGLFALNNVSVDLLVSMITTILGPSGSGKTTWLNVLSGLDNVTSGSIKFNGEELTGLSEDKLTLYRRENTGFIFQSYNLISTLTVRENVELGAYLSSNALDIDDVLKEVGLEEHK
ncbi:MAG: ATP-binding cassette domain-containing protein, partial [Mycoplasmatales bacterium]